VEAWQAEDLRRQAEAERRRGYDGHNRRTFRTSWRDVKARRNRRRVAEWLRRMV
jgi:hypothetical protein